MATDEPIFAEGVTTPMRLTGMREVFHPSGGRNHTHWFYEFEPDMEQGELMDSIRAIPDADPNDPTLDELMDGTQRATVGPFRLGTRRPTMDLCVGDLFDVILVPRDPLPVPEVEDRLGRVLRGIFDPQESEDNSAKIVAIVPLHDLEAAEYDLPPNMEGIPNLEHIDGGEWMSMSVVERLSAIAEARAAQR